MHGDREGLIRAYDEEEAAGFGLTDLAEDSEEEDSRKQNGAANGNGKKPYNSGIELDSSKSSDSR